MPIVRGQKFSYDKKGIKAAEKAAKKGGGSMKPSGAAKMYCAKHKCK